MRKRRRRVSLSCPSNEPSACESQGASLRVSHKIRPARLTDPMRLPVLTLQGVFLLLVMRMIMRRLADVGGMSTDVSIITLVKHVFLLRESHGRHSRLILLNHLRIQLIQRMLRQFNVRHQAITTTLAEILPHHHPHQLQSVAMRRHGVSGHDPPSLTQLMCQRKLIVHVLLIGIESECHEWQATATALGHDDEAQCTKASGEVISGAGEIEHDGAIATLAETDHLVVLAYYLRSALGEVQGEGRLVRTEVVNVEDEFLGEEFGGAPDDPANSGIDLP
jgi:hypothetical protein